MGLLDRFTGKFKGGPDFTRSRNIQFSLEEIKLSINLPIANIGIDEAPRDINIPFRNATYFNENSQRERQHVSLNLFTELWYYLSNAMVGRNLELGVLSCSLMVKKLPELDSEGEKATERLAKAVIKEYDAHYNNPTISEYGQGSNTRIRQEVADESLRRNTPWSSEELEREISMSIDKYGYPPLVKAKQININDRTWVFYQEKKSMVHNTDNFYCYPLDNLNYLCVRFRYRVDIQEKFECWQAHAQRAEQRMMESISFRGI